MTWSICFTIRGKSKGALTEYVTLRTRVGGGLKPPPTTIGLVGSRASRPRRGQDARDPSGNRAENQPPATYCVTSVSNRFLHLSRAGRVFLDLREKAPYVSGYIIEH